MSVSVFNLPGTAKRAIGLGAVAAIGAFGLLSAEVQSAQAQPPAADRTSPRTATTVGALGPVEIDYGDIDPGALPSAAGVPQHLSNRAGGKVKAATRGGAASQCQQSLWGPLAGDAAEANAIMAGRFELENYGVMVVKPNPNWRSQRSLDYSGNGLQHSLAWSLPLLRVGTATHNQAMINRFYALLTDWIKDNPIRKPRQAAAYGQIETGFRLLTMTCALAGPVPSPKIAKKIAGSLQTQGKFGSKHWSSVNNASFHHAAGIYAAGCALNNGKIKKAGLRFMSRISGRMIEADGSVNEGSIRYAKNTYLWTQQEIARVRACGSAPSAELRRSDLIPGFLANGVRPDGRYEAIGDGNTNRANPADASANANLLYAATDGTQGTVPSQLFSSYRAGFIFGRSGWGQSRSFGRETFYSVRTGAGRPAVFHAHSDQGSFTLSSLGKELVLDAGPYRTTSDAMAGFIRTRAAHNVVNIPGAKTSAPAPRVSAAASSGDGDFVSLTDSSYGSKANIARTVFYDRTGDYFIIMDDVQSKSARTIFQNWNLGASRSVALTQAADAQPGRADTDGGGSNVSLISVGTPSTQQVLTGSTSPYAGWNSANYGLIEASPSLHVNAFGKTARFVTVVIPRSSSTSAGAVSAVGELTAEGAVVTTTINSVGYRVSLTRGGYSRMEVPPPAPTPTAPTPPAPTPPAPTPTPTATAAVP